MENESSFDLSGFDFGDSGEGGDGGQAPSPAPVEAPAPAPAGIDPNEFEAVKKRAESWDQFRQALSQTMGVNQQPDYNDPQVALAQFAQDPNNYIQEMARQAINQQMEIQTLRNEFHSAHPNLVPFEQEIHHTANMIWMNAQQSGKPIGTRDAINQAVQNFQERLQSLNSQQSQATQAQFLKQNALPFNVNGGSQPTSAPVDFEKMTDSQFAQVRQAWKTSKGLP